MVSLTRHQLLASPNHGAKRRPRPLISAIACIAICPLLGRLLYHPAELGLIDSYCRLLPYTSSYVPTANLTSAHPQRRHMPAVLHIPPHPDLHRLCQHPRVEKGVRVRIICQLTTSPVLCRPFAHHITLSSSRHGKVLSCNASR